MMIDMTREALQRWMEIGRQHPVTWTRHNLGVDLWSAQKQIINSVRDNRNTQVDSCHGIGKTHVEACTALDFLFSYPRSRVIATAPTFRQIQSVLFPYVHQLHNGAPVELGGTLNQVELEIAPGWYFQGLSTNKPERFQGQHAPYILFIVDEDYGVAPGIFEAIRGGMSSGFVRFLGCGNPTDPGAWIAEAVRKRDDQGRSSWNHIQVSAFDTPNFTELGITVEDIRSGEWREKQEFYLKHHGGQLPRPYLINPDFVSEALIEFGEDSPAWQARVLGQLPSEATNTAIPLGWVEAAMQRWEHSVGVDLKLKAGQPMTPDDLIGYVPLGEPAELGVDVARFGDDDTVIAPRMGRRGMPLRIYRKQDGVDVAGLVDSAHDDLYRLLPPLKEGETRERALIIKVDSNGLGVGPLDNLRRIRHEAPNEQPWYHRAVGVNVSEAPRNRAKYADRTTELWWHLRELLNPMNGNQISLPRDNKLLGELSGRRYRMKGNLIQLESKDDFKKRLQRSPDRADAVVLAFAEVAPSAIETW